MSARTSAPSPPFLLPHRSNNVPKRFHTTVGGPTRYAGPSYTPECLVSDSASDESTTPPPATTPPPPHQGQRVGLQKKAFFEEHYARKKKRKSEDHGAAASADDGDLEAAEEEDGGSAASWLSSSSAESSCMTDQAPAPGDEETCGGEETGVVNCCGPRASDEPVGVAEELAAVTDAVSPSCRMDASVDALCHGEGGNEQVAGAVLELLEKKDLCSSNLVSVDGVDKQPLKESSIINQDITDSAKKRRLQMSSLLQKPTKFRSPPSGKKGQSSSVKRRSPLHSAKENTSPPEIALGTSQVD
ncbi:hypothetical protein SETIT_4G251100v2 [Setaria italica]|uniref:Uncharacterized protein n=1 Tax=Setaria italica TaxID=4555 RepID=A0A368QY49_SETIT|nr:hypothetical protein SETIT_4G251100v2 [Setaria italica]